MRRMRRRSKMEPTIALINVVFLMLVFFLVAGTVAPPIDGDVTLVRTEDLEGRDPADAIVLSADGARRHRGAPLGDLEAYVAGLGEDAAARIVPDRDVPARQFIALGRELRLAGAGRVLIVTEKGLAQ